MDLRDAIALAFQHHLPLKRCSGTENRVIPHAVKIVRFSNV